MSWKQEETKNNKLSWRQYMRVTVYLQSKAICGSTEAYSALRHAYNIVEWKEANGIALAFVCLGPCHVLVDGKWPGMH